MNNELKYWNFMCCADVCLKSKQLDSISAIQVLSDGTYKIEGYKHGKATTINIVKKGE